MLDRITYLVSLYGYWSVALCILLESAGVPLPGESALVIASAYAGAGKLSISTVIAIAATAAIIGDASGYWLGRTAGHSILRFLRIKEKYLNRIDTFYKKYGPKTVFFGRFVGILRTYSALFGGISRMPYGTFTVYNAAGGILWATIYGIIGYLFGKNLRHLVAALREVDLTLIILLVALIIGAYLWSQRSQKKRVQ
jgi:membrane protein DedA with SNARE-associated domain